MKKLYPPPPHHRNVLESEVGDCTAQGNYPFVQAKVKPKQSATRRHFWVERLRNPHASSCTCRGHYWISYCLIKTCAASDLHLQLRKRQRQKKKDKSMYFARLKSRLPKHSRPRSSTRSLDVTCPSIISVVVTKLSSLLLQLSSPLFPFRFNPLNASKKAQCVAVWTLMMMIQS